MSVRKPPEKIWAYDDGAHIMAFEWDNKAGGAVEFTRSDTIPKYGPGPHVAVDGVVWACQRIGRMSFTPKILVIKRDDGSTALPGGFVDPTDESLLSAVQREILEETTLDVHNCPGGYQMHPRTNKNRDPRSWVITFPFIFCIDPEPVTELPEVFGSDDAKEAEWIDFPEVMSRKWFLDHLLIVRDSGVFGNFQIPN